MVKRRDRRTDGREGQKTISCSVNQFDKAKVVGWKVEGGALSL